MSGTGIYFLNSFSLQFFCMALSATVFFIALACMVKNTIVQYMAIILFSLCLTISGFEFYFAPTSSPKPSNTTATNTQAKPHATGLTLLTYPQGYFILGGDLGYVLTPNLATSLKRHYIHADGKKELVYDATYTSNELGNRITPKNPNAKTAVLLFGCSFTIGEGIQDQETFAYKLGQKLGEQYQVFNLGLHGYGTHHIYTIIKSQLPELKKYDNILVYYLALRTHAERAAGLSPWDLQGPRYLLKGDKIIRDGNFTKQYPHNIPKLHAFLSKSFLYKRYMNDLQHLLIPFNTDAKRNKLLNALTTASIQELKAQYPNSTFNLLAWDKKTADILTELPKDVEISQITNWLTGYDTNPELYEIKYDKHPNALANSIMAEKLAELVKSDEQKITKK